MEWFSFPGQKSRNWHANGDFRWPDGGMPMQGRPWGLKETFLMSCNPAPDLQKLKADTLKEKINTEVEGLK